VLLRTSTEDTATTQPVCCVADVLPRCFHGAVPLCRSRRLQLNETLQCRAKSKGQAGAVTEALACVGVLARALHLAWQPYAQQLLSVMMLTGPSQVRIQGGAPLRHPGGEGVLAVCACIAML
jgi:hypothetical protein